MKTMNKIYKTLLVAMAVAIGLTSCDSNDEPYVAAVPAITVVSRDTNFPAAASEGSVKFTADGPVSVETANNWLSASVQGDEILIRCTQNDNLQGRTGVVTAKCGTSTTDINIIQEGILFQIPDMKDLVFSSSAATKEIPVTANAQVEVKSEVDWLRGSCSDGILKVEIGQNPLFDERSSCLSIIYGVNELKLPVSQMGIYLDIFDMTVWKCPDTRKSMSFSLPGEVDLQFETDRPDWLTSSVNPGTRIWKITAEANNSGHMRTCNFTYTLGTKTGTVKVEQCDFTKDLASDDYHLYFTNPKDNKRYFYNARLRKTGSNYKITLTDLKIDIPVTYDADEHAFGITGGQFCGNMDALKVFTTFVFYDATDSSYYFTWSSNWSMLGMPSFTESGSGGTTAIGFADSGNNPNVISYLELHGFSSTQLSGSTSEGGIVGLKDISLERVHGAAARTAALPGPTFE